MNRVKFLFSILSLCALLAVNIAAQTSGTLYFLPPNDPEWLRRTPHLYDIQRGQITKMKPDVNRCGWYSTTFTGASGAYPFLVYQGPAPGDLGKLGFKGVEDPEEWQPFMGNQNVRYPALIRLDTLVLHYGTTLYFDSRSGENGWSAAYPGPGPTKYCNYEIAAVIYDTDENVNCAFTSYSGGKSNTNCSTGSVGGTGIVRGIVQNTLGSDKKPQFNAHNGSGWDSDAFYKSFRYTQGVTVERCYEMPFTRKANGNWEFDSNNLTNDDGGLVGGFFPKLMYTGVNSDGSQPDYSTCTNCNKPNDISCSPVITFNGTKTWRGVNYTGLDAYDRTYMPDWTLASDGPNTSFGGCIRNPDGVYPLRNNSKLNRGNNQFCFESHAKFIYEGGEEFMFRGDDDIWVFINNKLVIDLGGTHRAAPGYVDLDTINPALVKGNEYNLDIFFCDRRSTESNVRVATNMYVVSENSLSLRGDPKSGNGADLCFYESGDGSCAAAMSGGGATEKCGGELSGMLDYYVIKFSDIGKPDAVKNYLDPDRNEECHYTGSNVITCYGGIELDLTTGRIKVTEGYIQGLTGTQYVMAEVKERDDLEPVKITDFRLKTYARMIWGNIVNDNGAAIAVKDNDGNTVTCSRYPSAVTGERVPICIAAGAWNANYTSFTVDDSTASNFQFVQTPLTNTSVNAALEIYDAKEGGNLLSRGGKFEIPKDPGYLVLWVTGSNKQLDYEYLYKINVTGSPDPDVELKSLIPYLRWVKSGVTATTLSPTPADSLIAVGQNRGSKRISFTPDSIDAEYVGQPIDLYLEAYNPDTKARCQTCTFNLRGEAYLITPSNPTGEEDPDIVTISLDGSNGIMKGLAKIEVSGEKAVTNTDSVSIKIKGQSDATVSVNDVSGAFIFWRGLQFKEVPVPRPQSSEIYDLNGDGIGDLLKIVYTRGFDKDSLPTMIEVFWGEDTLLIGKGQKDSEGNYVMDDKGANLEYWEPYLRKHAGSKNIRDRVDENDKVAKDINEKPTIIDTLLIPLTDPSMSLKEICTKDDNGKLYSSLPFYEQDAIGDPVLIHYRPQTKIQDKIPAVVISAAYIAGSGRCGDSRNNKCFDRLSIEFSEPVRKKPNSPEQNEEARNLFEYVLKVRTETSTYDILPVIDLPTNVAWSKVGNYPTDFDTVVTLTFGRFRSEGDNSYTPMAQDSVRFSSKKPYLEDANENTANPKEIGVEITGKNPFIVDKIAMGSFDPNDEGALARAINEVFNEYGIKAKADTIFSKSKPIAILPIPKNWPLSNISKYYPGTVGIVFRPDVSNTLVDKAMRDDIGKVSFDINSFYHTNLGEFVVNRKVPPVKCNSDIFPDNDCRKADIYVAWNMKDVKGRWVGAGAYVGLHDFRWMIDGIGEIGDNSVKRQVDMFGARRIKTKK